MKGVFWKAWRPGEKPGFNGWLMYRNHQDMTGYYYCMFADVLVYIDIPIASL